MARLKVLVRSLPPHGSLFLRSGCIQYNTRQYRAVLGALDTGQALWQHVDFHSGHLRYCRKKRQGKIPGAAEAIDCIPVNEKCRNVKEAPLKWLTDDCLTSLSQQTTQPSVGSCSNLLHFRVFNICHWSATLWANTAVCSDTLVVSPLFSCRISSTYLQTPPPAPPKLWAPRCLLT